MTGGQEVGTAVVDGVRLAYEERGMGSPVVFVHGFGTSSHSWRQVTEVMAESHRTVAVDLMGFGRSDKPTDQLYTVERQASLLRGFLTQLELTDPVLVGHSYGGTVCMMLLRLHRDLSLRSLVLVDAACYPQKFPLWLRALRTPVVGRLGLALASPEKLVRTGLQMAYHRPLAIRSDTVAAYAGAVRSPGGKHAVIATARHILPQDIPSLLRTYKQIQCPTLILWGEQDTFIPVAFAKRLVTEIPGSRIKVFDGCGHVPQEELPERVAQAVSEFLSMLPQHRF